MLDPNINKLEYPQKIELILGQCWAAWCIFHQAHGHDIEKCQTLTHQLTGLVEKGLLKKHLQVRHKDDVLRQPNQKVVTL